LLRTTDGLLVTADSSSMVSEGIFARRPVLAVAPTSFDLGRSEMAYRATLSGHGWMATQAIANLDAPRLLAEFAALTPQEDNPLDALAAVIAARIPALFA
jgi:mitochondrial fission protein ELM1